MASSGGGTATGAASVGRPTSPDTARNIWSTVDHMSQGGELSTMENLSERMGHYFNWNMDEVRVKIYEAVDCGLLRASGDNPPVFSVPTQDPVRPSRTSLG